MTPTVEQPKRKRVPMQQPVGACDADAYGRQPCGRPAREWNGFLALCTECADAMEKEKRQ